MAKILWAWLSRLLLIAIDRSVQYLSFRGFWVGDFIVGTMVFAIVLTMEKIGLSGFELVYFRKKQFKCDCTLHCTHCSNT